LKESSRHEVGREEKRLSLDFFSKGAKEEGKRHLFLENSATGVT
jgi:hypothetical protein